MKSNLKKALGMSIAILLTVSTIGNTMVYATEKTENYKSIQSVEELTKEIKQALADGEITIKEKEYILSNTPYEVIFAYISSLQDEINERINTNNFNTINTNDDKVIEEKIVSSNTYVVNEAVSVELDITDESDNSIETRGVTVTKGGEKKGLGARKTTGIYKEKFLGVTVAQLRLTLGYTVNSTNMKTRYSSASGSMSIGSLSTSSHITDNIAAKVGHDMNCVGSYDISIAGYASLNVGLTLQVKWYSNVDSKTKYITYKLSTI